MRVLIVDDEAPARARLQRLLQAFVDVQVVGQARDGNEALQMVASLRPDVVLLDVQMPGADGLAVAASLPEPAPAVVFVTAYDHYAVQAFDIEVVDYLLKPVEPERLARAIERLHALRCSPLRRAQQPPPSQLLISDLGRVHVVSVAEILWLEAADNYVVVHHAQGAPLMRRTLAGLLADLGPGFVRTHRSSAVALAQVVQLQRLAKGDATVLLRDGAQVACSRQYRAALLARLPVLA
ncbi:MAG: response regulator transcription factor [Rhodoferax sp.]|nr:response regulator transcription factor [Rhodoferax sp.]MBK9235807.1 response regulator transcription factor [Rhodoferax sp.]